MMLSLRRTASRHGRCGSAVVLASGRRVFASTESAAVSGEASKKKGTSARQSTFAGAAGLAAVSLYVGFVAGRYSAPPSPLGGELVLPNGLPRTCCDQKDVAPPLTEAQFHLAAKLQRIVGKENVLDGRTLDTVTTKYLKGARLGFGPALCIVTPRKLHHVVDAVEAAVDAGCIVLPQGQNTGLTGGSVPHFSDHDKSNNHNSQHDHRPVVLISLKHLDAIFPLDDGKRVVCLAGVGLATVRSCFERDWLTFSNR